ncbi:hypothetical protein VI26_11835 [Chromobacterium sp. LK1]|uniref:hypothetical protein n=1 Tax=Chromobacterium sp. LK1 TaxID=1628193 RepID=UPI000652D6AD|nr:hypothetical protein [Chromobacterium sp. LK1]KMN35343.1 hypothetical protein VI26_11835 [Chromobacterium sp. LK1]
MNTLTLLMATPCVMQLVYLKVSLTRAGESWLAWLLYLGLPLLLLLLALYFHLGPCGGWGCLGSGVLALLLAISGGISLTTGALSFMLGCYLKGRRGLL